MAHSAKTKQSASFEKNSLIQTLAVREEREMRSLEQASRQAEQMLEKARTQAQERLQRLESELNQLEHDILKRETGLGQQEAERIQAQAAKDLSLKKQQWEKNIPKAAAHLFEKIITIS